MKPHWRRVPGAKHLWYARKERGILLTNKSVTNGDPAGPEAIEIAEEDWDPLLNLMVFFNDESYQLRLLRELRNDEEEKES